MPVWTGSSASSDGTDWLSLQTTSESVGDIDSRGGKYEMNQRDPPIRYILEIWSSCSRVGW